MSEPLLFELSSHGRTGFSLSCLDVPEKNIDTIIPAQFQRTAAADLPELSEMDVMRHFVHLSSLNHHVDKGFYPLGSCTMKYNPKINETLSRTESFAATHPFQEEAEVPGALQLIGELAEYLAEITGMDDVTMQPAAGAHGEMTGIKIMRAYHEANGNPRHKIIMPDSAHGTNPASATISGYQTVQIRSTPEGLVDIKDLKEHLDEDVAGFMLTNPNTLGLFESQILEIAELVHGVGALLYMDGANLNALMGLVRPGDIGFDIMHFNLHKTFSTPHGGGGPGSGPVGVKAHLSKYLPSPVVVNKDGQYRLDDDRPDSIGKISGFYGNFGVMIRAYIYIRMLGAKGLKRVSTTAILNANYLMRILEKTFLLPHKQHAMHEFVLSGDWQLEKGVKTLDIAKRLLDYGIHAPTVYFPLIVHEAMMIEPTETESKETLDYFAETMIAIAKEVDENPEILHEAPVNTPVSRLDEGLAARNLNVKYVADAQ
ncbi:aminomethyl-transferring glycine dehydrogenase subunit GcvPB [bacterium]|nr:aminomethyl-transferring glycine dehydrogenase subunit GcvPB [bacterium]